MNFDYQNNIIKSHMMEGCFGLEKESLRVDFDGFLSHTKHPFGDNPNMERDFCENQTELITDVWNSVDEAWSQLAALHKKAVLILQQLESGGELLWPFSNPPYVRGENDIPIACYQESLKEKERYRRYLAEKYGKKKMLFSGIHFNFSFSEEILKAGYDKSGVSSYIDYKNSIYLELAKKVTRYSWLIVYLTAASPVLDGSFFRDDAIGTDAYLKYASARCSEIGYWNDFTPSLHYTDMDKYVRSIEAYVESGQLKSASELYYPVRLKPSGDNSLSNLKENGVSHIELRMLDLNPLSPVGIMKEDLKFLHLLLLYLMSLEDKEFELSEQIRAIQNEKRAAEYVEKNIWIETGWRQYVPVREAALDVLFDMERFFAQFDYPELQEIILYQEQKLLVPNNRYAVRVKQKFHNGYVKNGLKLAHKYANAILKEEGICVNYLASVQKTESLSILI